MKFKQNSLLIITTFLVFMSANSQAGRQGINFYYGLGLGVFDIPFTDIGAMGDIMVGIEEDGWALEAIGYASAETGGDDPTVDTSISGTQIGLAYRTIEENGTWYKFKVSSTDMTFDDSDTAVDEESSGNTYSIGWGIRMNREARLEIEYSYYDSSDLIDPVHLATVRYFWGGSDYQGKAY